MKLLKPILSVLILSNLLSVVASAQDQVIMVPPGNRYSVQPDLDDVVARRVDKQRKCGWDGVCNTNEQIIEQNYQNVLSLMTSDLHTSRPVLKEINYASQLYGVDPVAVLGCIVGEHTFNVKADMDMQDMAVRMAKSVMFWANKFHANNVDLSWILSFAEFDRCEQKSSQYDYWICAQSVWNSKFRGQVLSNGQSMPNESMRTLFFNPVGTGHTYGLGQLDPLRALMVSDLVNQVSGFEAVNVNNPSGVYDAILDPYKTVHYVAANVKKIVDTYRATSGFDISYNPGVIATLYNLGREWDRGSKRAEENQKSIQSGGRIALPEENFYGWFINAKEAELRQLLVSVPQ